MQTIGIFGYILQKGDCNSNDILLTDYLDKTAIKRLNNGGKVLLSLKKGTLKDEYGGNLAIGFPVSFGIHRGLMDKHLIH